MRMNQPESHCAKVLKSRLRCAPSAAKWGMLRWSGVQRSATTANSQKPTRTAVIVQNGVIAEAVSAARAALGRRDTVLRFRDAPDGVVRHEAAEQTVAVTTPSRPATRRRRNVLIALLAAGVVLGAPSGGVGAPPIGLSARGRALWNFEALLHDKFGGRPVCARSGTLNFVAGRCSPLATWSPYFYVFATSRRSQFRTTPHRPRGSFGNYPVLVRISGQFVSCGPRGRRFLIAYSDAATFTVDCLSALR